MSNPETKEEEKKEFQKEDTKKEPEKKKDDEEMKNLETSMYQIKLGDSNYEDSLKIAEKFKEEGNNALKENKFQEANNKYSAAINLKIETKKNSIYYSNRALVDLKLENYGSAIQDANNSIEIDSTYLKAYYRRADANSFLEKYKEAIKDYSFLLEKLPNDSNLKEKINLCKIRIKKKNFWDAFNSEGRSSKQTIESLLKKITVESSYEGPKMNDNCEFDKDWILKLIDYMQDMELKKDKSKKYIHKKFLLLILKKLKEYFSNQKESLIDITIPENAKFTVVGDLHGQFYDLLNIFKINGYPSEENPYLFNGDFVDRGVFSVECITTLMCFKILYPNHVFLARGNHENRNMNKMYGFEAEVADKYDNELYECFVEFFNTLPLGHILNKKVLVVHGGLFSKDGVKIEDLKKIDRFREIPEEGLMSEMLWSDPCKEMGRIPSKRGVGMSFGPDVAERFLNDNGLDLLIRSHEVKQEGYEIEPGNKVITVFSAPNYCDQMGNKGAIIIFKGGNMKPEFVTFSAVQHPDIKISKYLTPFLRF